MKISTWFATYEYSTQQMSLWKNSNECFATTFRPLTKTIMILTYLSTFLVHFTMLPPMLLLPHDWKWEQEKKRNNNNKIALLYIVADIPLVRRFLTLLNPPNPNLQTTLCMMVNITYYLELFNAIIFYCISHFLPAKVEFIVLAIIIHEHLYLVEFYIDSNKI